MKVKAQSLRIGNYITYTQEGTDTVQVTISTLEAIISGSEYHGIPLDEDWLRRWGFTRRGHWFDKESALEVKVIAIADGLYIDMGGNYIQIRTVHGFQNIWFALVGHELVRDK